jgi:hypothetical protein
MWKVQSFVRQPSYNGADWHRLGHFRSLRVQLRQPKETKLKEKRCHRWPDFFTHTATVVIAKRLPVLSYLNDMTAVAGEFSAQYLRCL